MKNHYEEPVLEVSGFDCEDIITTSGVGILPGPGMGGGNEGETDFEDW